MCNMKKRLHVRLKLQKLHFSVSSFHFSKRFLPTTNGFSPFWGVRTSLSNKLDTALSTQWVTQLSPIASAYWFDSNVRSWSISCRNFRTSKSRLLFCSTDNAASIPDSGVSSDPLNADWKLKSSSPPMESFRTPSKADMLGSAPLAVSSKTWNYNILLNLPNLFCMRNFISTLFKTKKT